MTVKMKKYIIDRNSIKHGLKSGDIKAWFQPKASLDNGKIIGAEALARWNHQEYGLLLPSTFMNSIKNYKLQRDLLLKMLDDTIDTYLMLQHSGYIIPISVNLPPSLLDDLDLPDFLYKRVHASGIKTTQITFEILEDETISDSKNYHIGVDLLRLRGFKLAQDDFGRGYSSIYNLISTPFTEIKLDRTLVNNAVEDDVRRTVLISLVQLSKNLGLYVTAEGVETHADLDFLRNIDCDAAQGFLISAALSPEKLKKFLVSNDSEVYLDLPLHG